MAHFAEIDKDSNFIRVLVVANEFEKDGQGCLTIPHKSDLQRMFQHDEEEVQ